MGNIFSGITATQLKVFTTDAIAAAYPGCPTWIRLAVIGFVTTIYVSANAYFKSRATRANHVVPGPTPPVA